MSAKENSIEMLMLRRQRAFTVADVIRGDRNMLNLLSRVAERNLVRHLGQLKEIYRDAELPDHAQAIMIHNNIGKQWHRVEQMSSRQIRSITNMEVCITNTKLVNMDPQQAALLYRKIARLRSIANRTKLLRLLHGDVYCGSRLYRFGLSTNDRCIRCFGCETINHLLLECPYSKEVWSRIGITANGIGDILKENIKLGELEILAELISALVFRKQVLPPDMLIRTTIYKFKDGLSRQNKTIALATDMVDRYELTGQWFT
jgi:hypothetical protein